MELIGQRFGHIRVTDVVGQGGMGDVYGGYDEKLERRVALKALAPEQRLDTEARERLLREARALSKLDHPNICRIHDYIESDEADLLILEFIDGRTLGELMATDMPRAEKLRICTAVASVLVAAHRAGIVHRDLKPENVMLTKNGEVKVLDFGLARWLQRSRAQSSTQQMPAPQILLASASDVTASFQRKLESGPLETAAGIAMGTPLYMSPEQARGEVLTPASDMFSFGLLMQAVFTGSDPHPTALSGREVMLKVARGETNPVAGVQGDVAALIQRLKQFAPADRPTAVEAVERLQYMSAKPQRIARRGAAAAVVALLALGGWRYTVDLQTERSKALASEAEAVKRRGEVEDLLEFMLGDLRKKLEPVGRLDVLDDAAQRALKYVSTLDPQRASAEELARNAKALNQLVEVRVGQGKFPEAQQVAERSVQLTTLAAAKAPNDGEILLASGLSHYWLGLVHWRQNDHARALEEMRAYSAITERLAQRHPENETYQLERAYGHSTVATVLESSGELKRALQEFQATRAVKEARVAASPDAADRQADLAVTINKIGFVLHRLGDYEGAIRSYDAEMQIYRRLLAGDPSHAIWKDRLARSHGYAAASREARGELNAALRHVEDALQHFVALHAHDPDNASWTRNLAMTHLQVAWLRTSGREIPLAASHVARAGELMQGLLEKDPKSKTWRREYAIVLLARARCELVGGRVEQAARSVASARQELERVAGDLAAQRSLADADFLEGDVLAASGQRDRALRAWDSAAQRYQALPAYKTDPSVQSFRVRSLLRLARFEEAAPIIRKLQRAGFRQADFVSDLREFRVRG